jgi:hypothetical protein
MKARRILKVASFLFLIVAVSCLYLATRLPDSGVRIPVHCANGKIGFIDHGGWMEIAPVWDSATPFGSNDQALVSITREPDMSESLSIRRHPEVHNLPRTLHYRIDRQGRPTAVDPPLFDPFHIETKSIGAGEMALVEKGAEYRWMLGDGTPAFPGSWQQAKDFQRDDPAAVLGNRRWGFINRKGENIIPFRWDDTLGFDGNGRACVAISRKWGAIDREGRLVVPLQFKSLTGFDDAGFAAAELPSGSGFIDREGKITIPFRYHKAEPFDSFGMAKIQLASDRFKPLAGWIDRNGKSIIDPRYEVESPVWAANFANHQLLPVIESGKAGLIDRKGRTVVASAQGELKPVIDPIAPGVFWITTIPYRSIQSPNGKTRPPFQPACHDSAGTLIWSGATLTKAKVYAILAAILGLMSAFLFLAGKRAAG